MLEAKNIEQMLRDEGFVVSGVKGRSMLPTLTQGVERCLIVPPTFPLKPNTVALYKSNGVYVLHRVIAPEPGGYLIRGDHTVIDEHIKESSICGVLSGFWRGEEFIECTDEYNAAIAKKSARTLPIRKVSHALYMAKYRFAKFRQKLFK